RRYYLASLIDDESLAGMQGDDRYDVILDIKNKLGISTHFAKNEQAQMRGLIAPGLTHVGSGHGRNGGVWLSRTRRFRWRMLAFLPPTPSEPVPPVPAVSRAQSNRRRWPRR